MHLQTILELQSEIGNLNSSLTITIVLFVLSIVSLSYYIYKLRSKHIYTIGKAKKNNAVELTNVQHLNVSSDFTIPSSSVLINPQYRSLPVQDSCNDPLYRFESVDLNNP